MEKEVQLVGLRRLVCCAIGGPPGIGKTFLTTRALQAIGVPHKVSSGTGVGLLHDAYRLRKRGVLLLDDADELVTGGGMSQANRMKELLAPVRTRTIYNMTDKAAMNENKDDPNPNILPTQFDVECGVIWLTNINLAAGSLPKRFWIGLRRCLIVA